ncbi:MAG: AzlD domain-containing protein [Chloroflexota bacterium]
MFLTILGMGAVTFGIRFFFIALSDRLEIPDIVRRGLNYVPVAVLSAIVLPDMLLIDGDISLSWTNPRLIAGLVAILVSWRFKNIGITLVIGMLVLWGWGAVLG